MAASSDPQRRNGRYLRCNKLYLPRQSSSVLEFVGRRVAQADQHNLPADQHTHTLLILPVCNFMRHFASSNSTQIDFVAAMPGAFVQACAKSLGVIFASEIGDKTFFIAALLAMRHPRSLVGFSFKHMLFDQLERRVACPLSTVF
jgi:hypothetical protein